MNRVACMLRSLAPLRTGAFDPSPSSPGWGFFLSAARTEAGRKAKVLVLLARVLDWRGRDERVGYDVLMARRLLIDFVGGEAGASLRKQFA